MPLILVPVGLLGSIITSSCIVKVSSMFSIVSIVVVKSSNLGFSTAIFAKYVLRLLLRSINKTTLLLAARPASVLFSCIGKF